MDVLPEAPMDGFTAFLKGSPPNQVSADALWRS